MPLTVITLTNAPPSLRGDLTKWMQEISTGVYIGNFNSRIREELWERVKQSVGKGEATLSYSTRNETGYNFEVYNNKRKVKDFDGISLVMIPIKSTELTKGANIKGYSNAAKFQKIKKVSKPKKSSILLKDYVVLDIETTGLDLKESEIIEIGALKVINEKTTTFNRLIKINKDIPTNIIQLTGINNELLVRDGEKIEIVLKEFLDFLGDSPIVGYGLKFDIDFINRDLKSLGFEKIKNKRYDLLQLIKGEKMFMKDYKLESSLEQYDIVKKVPHRALEDAKLIYQLSLKVNKFRELMKVK